MKKTLILISFPLLFIACDAITGKEVARLKINQVSTDSIPIIKQTTLDLTKGTELKIWSDMDIEYDGDIELRFRIHVLKDGKEFKLFEIDPTQKNISIKEFRSSINGKTKWSFTGKNGELNIEEDGKYTVESVLIASENPTLKINKAELVLKE